MPKPLEITTERLLLRRWRAADRQPFAALNADPEVMQFFPSVLDREQSDALVNRFESLMDERGWGFWAVEVRETKQFVGYVGLHIPAADLPFKPCVEIGWRLARAAWGKGYATEAAKAALDVGFNTLALPEIVSFTTLKNLRSRAVMQRLGMVEDPSTFEHPSVRVGSELREHCLYRLSCAQWGDRQAR